MSSELQQLPLFPLNTVIFPGGVLPLQIFEVRYLDMVKDCVRDQSGFGIVLIRDGKEQMYKTGTLCRISDWGTLPNGLLGITARGEKKIHVNETHTAPNKLIFGYIEEVREPPSCALPGGFEPMRHLLRKVISKVGEPYSDLPVRYDHAGWVGARLVELLPLRLSIKQRLLEIEDHVVRLHHLEEVLQKYKFL